MSRHPSTEALSDNRPVLSVGELSMALKRHVESGFEFVRVRGEISGFKRAASGHLYFSLKDTEACLDGVCWRMAASRLAIDPADGLEVIASGKLTTYPDRSKYQLVVEQLELAGEGALLKLLEERRKRLAAEGLFDAARKRPLPFLPDVIGVVTSPTGAVIRDILHRLDERFPRHVLLWPVLVQGVEAPAQVAAAIAGFSALLADGPVPRPDLVIVARGGGSLEDLWAFNEEVVVRAAAASSIPLISAVGHETDTTLIDFAADVRAPTPTAAAEMAVPVRIELAARLVSLESRLASAMTRSTQERQARLLAAARGLPKPQSLLAISRQRLDDWGERLQQGLQAGIERRRQRLLRAQLTSPLPRIERERGKLAAEARARNAAFRAILTQAGHRLAQAKAQLEGVSYQRTLERGFALVRDPEGRVLMRASSVPPASRLTLTFTDGEVGATADGERDSPSQDQATKDQPPRERAVKKRSTRDGGSKPRSDNPRQGRLL